MFGMPPPGVDSPITMNQQMPSFRNPFVQGMQPQQQGISSPMYQNHFQGSQSPNGFEVPGPRGVGQHFADFMHQHEMPAAYGANEPSMGMKAVGEQLFGLNPQQRIDRGFEAVTNPYSGFQPPQDQQGSLGSQNEMIAKLLQNKAM